MFLAALILAATPLILGPERVVAEMVPPGGEPFALAGDANRAVVAWTGSGNGVSYRTVDVQGHVTDVVHVWNGGVAMTPSLARSGSVYALAWREEGRDSFNQLVQKVYLSRIAADGSLIDFVPLTIWEGHSENVTLFAVHDGFAVFFASYSGGYLSRVSAGGTLIDVLPHLVSGAPVAAAVDNGTLATLQVGRSIIGGPPFLHLDLAHTDTGEAIALERTFAPPISGEFLTVGGGNGSFLVVWNGTGQVFGTDGTFIGKSTKLGFFAPPQAVWDGLNWIVSMGAEDGLSAVVASRDLSSLSAPFPIGTGPRVKKAALVGIGGGQAIAAWIRAGDDGQPLVVRWISEPSSRPRPLRGR